MIWISSRFRKASRLRYWVDVLSVKETRRCPMWWPGSISFSIDSICWPPCSGTFCGSAICGPQKCHFRLLVRTVSKLGVPRATASWVSPEPRTAETIGRQFSHGTAGTSTTESESWNIDRSLRCLRTDDIPPLRLEVPRFILWGASGTYRGLPAGPGAMIGLFWYS
jgi:hypothetical protein